MKQIIGSRMAAKLAVQKFGDNAGILRHRRCFMIVKIWYLSRRLSVTSLKGIGTSWEKALVDAGIELPTGKGIITVYPLGIFPTEFYKKPIMATQEETDKLIEESQE